MKEFQGTVGFAAIKRKIKEQTLISFGISLLACFAYSLKQEWLFSLILIVGLYFQIIFLVLNYYYLPKLIGDLNRKHIARKQGG